MSRTISDSPADSLPTEGGKFNQVPKSVSAFPPSSVKLILPIGNPHNAFFTLPQVYACTDLNESIGDKTNNLTEEKRVGFSGSASRENFRTADQISENKAVEPVGTSDSYSVGFSKGSISHRLITQNHGLQVPSAFGAGSAVMKLQCPRTFCLTFNST